MNLTWEQEVAGSNPAAPTSCLKLKLTNKKSPDTDVTGDFLFQVKALLIILESIFQAQGQEEDVFLVFNICHVSHRCIESLGKIVINVKGVANRNVGMELFVKCVGNSRTQSIGIKLRVLRQHITRFYTQYFEPQERPDVAECVGARESACRAGLTDVVRRRAIDWVLRGGRCAGLPEDPEPATGWWEERGVRFATDPAVVEALARACAEVDRASSQR